MTKIIFILIFPILFLASCTVVNNKHEKIIIEYKPDTAISSQTITKLKNVSNDIFQTATYTGKEPIEIKYRLFSPNQKKDTKYPLVIVFHGSGAIGTDNVSQLGLLPKLFASQDIQNKYPAYVIAPQFPTRSSDYVMDTSRNVLNSNPRSCLNTLLELIDSLKTSLNIDNNRIYVVGFSMGGSTVINSLIAKPELFAAGISISGIPQFGQNERIKTIPIWLIHGTDDTENPITSDEQFYKERKKHIRFWKLEGKNHGNVFTSTILGETLPEWLFKQHRN